MRYLLDTHAFLWKIAEPTRIPEKVYDATKNPDNEVYISAVSLWEIAIKTRLKKLSLGGVPNDELIDLASRMGIATIGLAPEEAATYGNLAEDTHFDPFDRMLIWQAISRKLTLISSDVAFTRFRKNGLKLLWK